MKHLSIAILGVLLAVTAAPLAQAPTPANIPPASRPQTPAQTTQRPDRDIDDDVNVTGCLRLWDPSIGALPGDPSTGPRYVLVDARQDENPGKDVVVLRRYVVVGDPSVNLAGHIDKTVHISGDVTPLPGTATLPPAISDTLHAQPGWLTLTASAIEGGGSCTDPR